MSIEFDPQHDFEMVIDGLESVELTPLGGGPAIELQALRGAPTQQEVNLLNDSVGLKLDDCVWHFADAPLDGHVPETGDTITDGESQVWTVVATSRHLLRKRWRVICQKYEE